MNFDDISKINGKNLIEYWKEHKLTIDDFHCRKCGQFMIDLDDIVDVGYNTNTKIKIRSLYKSVKSKQFVESEHNRWLIWGRTLSGKTFFRKICWKCFFEMLPEIEDIPKRARKSSWYKDILNGNFRPPATWTSPSKYFKLLFDITDEELEKEHKKFDTASLESFKRRHGEKNGEKKYIDYVKRQAYTCSREYMVGEKGMTDDEWNNFNASRACTEKNFIKRYGKDIGLKKWDEYCKLESYVGCKLEYFIEKYGERDGIKKYLSVNQKKAQTLENYINKYGEIVGKQKYDSLLGKQYSESSKKLFDEIQEKIGIIGINAKYAETESAIVVSIDDEFVNCYPDYILNTKIIEYNGDYWHMNPKIYKPNDKIPFTNIISKKIHGDCASDIWEYDRKKKEALEKLGYKVKVIWESDCIANRDAIINECVKYLLG